MLHKNMNRREFLKLAGLSMGAMAFRPVFSSRLDALSIPKPLAEFPDSEVIGRITDPGVFLRSKPSNEAGMDTVIRSLEADTLLEWNQEVVGSVIGGLSNQKYVETPLGYVYGSVIQPTKNIPNTPITEIPAGHAGFWAEVTVPYVDLAHEGTTASPWLRDHILYNFPPRLYYGQVVWIDRIRTSNGFVEYRWNEDANGRGYGYGGSYGEYFWGDGTGFKVLYDEDVSTISPDVDPVEKTMGLNLDYQTLSCYEAGREVFFCRVSTGVKFTSYLGEEIDYSTPPGTLLTHWKIMSKNMTAGEEGSGYSTPAVPWCVYIQGGIAIHGAFWHNAFGETRSHGCVNVTPEASKWIFRWSMPYVSLDAGEERRSLPDHGTIVYSRKA